MRKMSLSALLRTASGMGAESILSMKFAALTISAGELCTIALGSIVSTPGFLVITSRAPSTPSDSTRYANEPLMLTGRLRYGRIVCGRTQSARDDSLLARRATASRLSWVVRVGRLPHPSIPPHRGDRVSLGRVAASHRAPELARAHAIRVSREQQLDLFRQGH